MKHAWIILILTFQISGAFAQTSAGLNNISSNFIGFEKVKSQYMATSGLLDAAINSINSLNSLIKKENYRNKVISINNPSSTEIGFNLEMEIHAALQPILEKTKNTNKNKFSEVISTFISNPDKYKLSNSLFTSQTIFSSVINLVGSLAIRENKVTRQDLDSFVLNMSRYFAQYEKLDLANKHFEDQINKFNARMNDLQFDSHEFISDLITIINPDIKRVDLKFKSLEDLLLHYLDKTVLDTALKENTDISGMGLRKLIYPGDGIKTAKDIVYGIFKMFNEYQNVYTENYKEIRLILLQSKALGKNVNIAQVDRSIAEIDELYTNSKEADILNLRLNTLSDRLKLLVITEQVN